MPSWQAKRRERRRGEADSDTILGVSPMRGFRVEAQLEVDSLGPVRAQRAVPDSGVERKGSQKTGVGAVGLCLEMPVPWTILGAYVASVSWGSEHSELAGLDEVVLCLCEATRQPERISLTPGFSILAFVLTGVGSWRGIVANAWRWREKRIVGDNGPVMIRRRLV